MVSGNRTLPTLEIRNVGTRMVSDFSQAPDSMPAALITTSLVNVIGCSIKSIIFHSHEGSVGCCFERQCLARQRLQDEYYYSCRKLKSVLNFRRLRNEISSSEQGEGELQSNPGAYRNVTAFQFIIHFTAPYCTSPQQEAPHLRSTRWHSISRT